MKVTYLGTTVLLFDDGVDQILFDCHLTRPSLVKCFLGKLRTDEAAADRVVEQFAIRRLRAIFVSHTHHDHVMDAPYVAKKCGADIYGSASAMQVALGGGIGKEKLHCYDDAMEYSIGAFHIRVIPSVHSIAHWYNNDLGQVITRPVTQPARKSDYKEGGSFDFLVEHSGKRYLIRPSYNYIEGQLDGIRADVLFLGVAGISKDTPERKRTFFAETVDKVQPELVIPVHWDNFFTPLFDSDKWNTGVLENPEKAVRTAREYSEAKGTRFLWQQPLSTAEV